MKILYITPNQKTTNIYSEKREEYDFSLTKTTIENGITEELPDTEIIYAGDLFNHDGCIPNERLTPFDLCICDITTSTPSILHVAGIVEGMGMSIIYFRSSGCSIPLLMTHKNLLTYSEASLEHEFRHELNERIKQVRDNPEITTFQPSVSVSKPKAFISYSHANKEYLDRLMVHLKPLEKKGLIDIWQDTKIKTGDKWEEEIKKALSEATIAILMISADFMASDFIIDDELPPLLQDAEVKGTKIVPLILSPCRFSREPTLSRFQAANQPNEPLSLMSEDHREEIYDKLASDIEKALS